MSTLKTLLLTYTLLSLISCDPVRLRREQQNGGSSADALSTDGSLFTDVDANSGTQNAEGFSHCDSAQTLSATNIGPIKACQNSYDRTNVRIQLGPNSQAEALCVIPMVQGQSGSVALSTYQGASSGCFAHQANKIMVGVLRGDNPQYFGTNPNSIMVIKQSQLNNFYECSDAINRYIQNPTTCCTQSQNSSCQFIKSPQQCNQEALNYRVAKCTQFKNTQKNINYLLYPFQ